MQFTKFNLIITLCLLSFLGISQNKVGIGTESPDAKLTVHSDTTGIKSVVNFVGDIDLRSIYGYSKPNPGWGYGAEFEGGYIGVLGDATAEDYSGSAYGMFASATGTAGNRYGIYGLANGVGPNNNIGVYGFASGGVNNWAGYFNGHGYFQDSLGIGVQNPLERVHIFGNLRVDSGSIRSWGQLTFHPDVDLSGDDVIQFLNSDGNETVRIHNNGNVGIGTDTPAGPLEIEKVSASANPNYLLLLHNPNNSTGANAMLAFSASGAEIGENAFVPAAIGIKRDEGLVFKTATSGDNPPTRMVIKSTGEIGIGTNDIATGHLLSVNGKIACEEIRVDLSQNWPDYVFDQNYDMLTLKETEKFIQSNGHLPGIPSAVEVEKTGIQVGEMNRLLMEKVEELTLHLIEHQKLLDQQQKMIDQLLKSK